MNGKTVYLLGAGATKAVCEEAPLNKDLVRKALSKFDNSPEAKLLIDFINDLFHKRVNPPIDNQIWNLLDYIIQQRKSPSLKYNIEKIEELRGKLLNLIIRYVKESLLHTDTQTCEKFVLGIKNSQPSIISTNYDIVIDNALSKIENFNYGAKIRYSTTAQGLMLGGLKRAVQTDEGNLNKGYIQLLKIHGSLNWLYCPKCDEVDLTIGEKGSIETSTGLYCSNRDCTNKYEPLLITPTMFKNYGNKFITEVWSCAEKELTIADNLVFVGYALKDEDYQIRCLLMKALLNKEKNYDKIVIVEKEPKDKKEQRELEKNVKKKYEDLYEKVLFLPIDFKEYVRNPM